jgi:hypothetical protein
LWNCSIDRIEGDNLLCSAKFEEPLLGALSSCMTFSHRIEGDKLAVVVVELQ